MAPLLTATMVSIIALFIGVITLLDIRRTDAIFWNQLEQSGLLTVQGINDQVVDSLYELNLERLDSLAVVVSSRPDFNQLQIFTPEGRTLVDAKRDYAATSSIAREHSFPIETTAHPLGTRAVAEGRRLVETEDKVLGIAWPVTVGDRIFGGVYLALGSDSLRSQIRGIVIEHIWQGLILIATGVIVSYLIARYVAKPIRSLTAAAQQIGGGDLDAGVPVAGAREIFQLGGTLEHMRAELQTLYQELEQRVEQRTHELDNANQELKRGIAERERAEQERRAVEIQALSQSKLATLGEVATGLAHEINQPLTYISTIAQVILEDLKMNSLDHTQVESQLSEAYRQVGRIDRIIQHLRTFGRADEGEMLPVELETILDNTLLLMSPRIRLSDIELDRRINPDVPKVIGSPNQLEQMFINLFQNSIDAVETVQSEGKISIHISHVAGGDFVQIEFGDNGHGIPQENLDRVFDPFFTTKPVGQGTGLGLSIVYGIVRDHGGTIACESTLNQGTTFVITLPVEGGPSA